MSISLSRAVARPAALCLVAVVSVAAFVSRAAAGTANEATAHAVGVSEIETNRHGAASLGASLENTTRGHYASTPLKLRPEGANEGLLAFPPSASAAARPMTVVYLHGVSGRAENGCPWFRAGASELGWLVCPEAAVHGADGTASWGGDVFAQSAVVSRAMRTAEANGASPEPGVAIGFSQGGYVALDLVKTRRARFRGLVLIAAHEAHPSAQKLREAGVERVALAAGSLDIAHDPLVADARRLQSEGFDARFYDLGHVGHTYATEDTRVLREAIAWAGGLE